ncbi:MAG: hypothetical protein ACRDY0_03960, partial [Acidimicrobiales bacterium]
PTGTGAGAEHSTGTAAGAERFAGTGARALRPATPPADFDLDQALSSLRRFRDRRPAGIALAHYGLVPDPVAILDEAESALRRWAEVAEAAWRAGADVASALQGAFAADWADLDGDERRRLETLNGVHSNAAGLTQWLERTGT